MAIGIGDIGGAFGPAGRVAGSALGLAGSAARRVFPGRAYFEPVEADPSEDVLDEDVVDPDGGR